MLSFEGHGHQIIIIIDSPLSQTIQYFIVFFLLSLSLSRSRLFRALRSCSFFCSHRCGLVSRIAHFVFFVRPNGMGHLCAQIYLLQCELIGPSLSVSRSLPCSLSAVAVYLHSLFNFTSLALTRLPLAYSLYNFVYHSAVGNTFFSVGVLLLLRTVKLYLMRCKQKNECKQMIHEQTDDRCVAGR